MELSKQKQSTLYNIVSDLQKIHGVAAVVLLLLAQPIPGFLIKQALSPIIVLYILK